MKTVKLETKIKYELANGPNGKVWRVTEITSPSLENAEKELNYQLLVKAAQNHFGILTLCYQNANEYSRNEVYVAGHGQFVFIIREDGKYIFAET